MRRSQLAALVAVVSAVGLAAFASTATGAEVPPSVSAVKALASSATLVCGGGTDVTVTLTGHAGETGSATDIELVLDVSGSMAGAKLTDLKNAATAFVQALDARDGADDSTLARGNRVGITVYRNTSATGVAPLGTNEAALVATIASGLGNATGNSPHAAGIAAGQAALTASTGGKAIVLMTDGLTNQAPASAAATTAKAAGIRIVSIGVGTDASVAALQSWATAPGADNYQAAGSGFDANELVKDVGAAVAVPASFTVVETAGPHFAQSSPVATAGTNVVAGAGTLTWTGSLGEGQLATLTYHVTRDGSDVFSVTNETVSSTTTLSVTGGTATISPTGGVVSLDVLPCGGAPLDQETCTGAACTASATQGGVQFSVNAGTPSGTTDIFLTGFSQAPPSGACPGFNTNTNGVQFDIRPLTTDGTFEMVIPKATLLSSGKKWWQTEVCIGTNLRFITKLNSLANLRPGASMIGGGNVPGRWWGVLPSIPRYTLLPNIGWVRGPWVNHRSVRANGDAVVRIVVPYVPNSTSLTTDGKAAYDPKMWGG